MNTRPLTIAAACLVLAACGDKADQDSDIQEDIAMDDTMMPMDDGAPMDDSVAMDDPATPVVTDSSQATDFVEPDRPQYGPNDIVYAMTDRDATARLALTPTSITMRITPDAVERIQGQVRSRDLKDDLKAAILASIQEVAVTELQSKIDEQRQKMSRHQIRYALPDVNDIFFKSDRLWIDLQNEKSLSFDDIRAPNGRPVLTNFDAADAMKFVTAYETVR